MSLSVRVRRVAIAHWVLLTTTIGIAAATGTADAQLTDQVPDGLSAAEYFRLAKEYKAAGWPEQARDALTRSIKADPEGIGKKAQVYLTAYIPRHPVSSAAVQKNIVGFNQMAQGDLAAAIRTFLECIQEFPNF